MNEFKKDIQEDAKSDWLKIVNKHKKRQKGLPALSTLNTNAGNVEHNINMFNMMQPSGFSVDAATGNTSSGGMSEAWSWKQEKGDIYDSSEDENNVILHYYELPVTAYESYDYYYDSSRGGIEQGGGDDYTIYVDYEYEVDRSDIEDFLSTDDEVLQYIGDTSEDITDIISARFDELVTKFKDKILDTFEDDAIDHFDTFEDYSKYESLDRSKKYNCLDDKFDMSMRTLL